MKILFKLLIIVSVLTNSYLLSGCGQIVQQTTTQNNSPVSSRITSADNLSYHIDVTPSTGNSYIIGFTITNPSAENIDITFPYAPVSYYYEIFDENGTRVQSKQHGMLCVLRKVTIEAGQSFSTTSFTYKKDSTATYQIKNSIDFYLNVADQICTATVTTTF